MMTAFNHSAFRRLAGLIVLTGILGGCVGMKLTADGARVAQAAPNEVGSCELVGKVTSSIPSRALNRLSPGKVREQLIVMARNESPGLGGDTVVPAGPVTDGEQEFNVFRCR